MYKTVSQRLQRGREREKAQPKPERIPELPEILRRSLDGRINKVAERQRLLPLITHAAKTGTRLSKLIPKWLRYEIGQAGGSQSWLRRWYVSQGRQPQEHART